MYVPGGHRGTTSRHSTPASAVLDQDRVTMPPQPPRPRQQRGTGPFHDAELGALPRFHTLEQAGGNPPGTPINLASHRKAPFSAKNPPGTPL